MPVPQLDVRFPSLGNVLKTEEAIKGARTARAGAGIRNILSAEKLVEFQTGKEARKETAERAKTIQELDLSTKQLDLANRTVQAMKDELVSITVDEYPEFLKKWSDAKVDVTILPTAEEIGNDPQKFRGLQRQAATTAKTLEAEFIEEIKRKGLKERKAIEVEGQIEKKKIDVEAQKAKTKIINDAKIEIERLKKEGKVPDGVAKAQQLVLNLAKRKAPSLAETLATALINVNDPESAASQLNSLNDDLQSRDSVPDELKQSYNNAIKLLNDYYSEQTKGLTRRLQFDPEKGFTE